MFGITMGFDMVIGNPPYVRVDEIAQQEKDNYSLKFKTATGKYDLYYLFFEKGFELLNGRSVLSFISPNKYCAATSAANLRKKVFESISYGEIVSTSKLNVFEDAANYPVISIFIIGGKKYLLRVREASSINSLDDSTFKSYQFPIKRFMNLPDIIIPINVSQMQIDIVVRLRESFERLGNFFSFSEGLRIPTQFEKEKQEDHLILKQYQFEKFSPIKEGTWISGRNLKKVVSEASNRYNKIFRDKIVVSEDALVITATIDKQNAIPQGGVYFGVPTGNDVPVEYFLGLLNSKLLSIIYEVMFSGMHMGGGYLRYRTKFLEELPVTIAEPKILEQISILVKKIMITKSKSLTMDTGIWEWEIDRLVYKLYGLTEEEIAVVEGSCSK
jgi:hypothetical protein